MKSQVVALLLLFIVFAAAVSAMVTDDNYPRFKLLTAEGIMRIITAAGKVDALKALLESNDVDINDADENGATALHLAAANGHVECVDELIRNKASVDVLDGSNTTPLIKAAWNGHAGAVRLLIAAGANIEVISGTGLSALHSAAANGFREILAILIEAGANIAIQGENQVNALHLAIWKEHEGCVEELVWAIQKLPAPERYAILETRDRKGYTALYYATLMNRLGSIQILVLAGADVNVRNTEGHNLLHYVAERGFLEALNILLESKRAQLNLVDRSGNTPLHVAVAAGNSECLARMIAENPGLLAATNNNGKSVLEFISASSQRNSEVVLRALHNAGITPNNDNRHRNGGSAVRRGKTKKVVAKIISEEEHQESERNAAELIALEEAAAKALAEEAQKREEKRLRQEQQRQAQQQQAQQKQAQQKQAQQKQAQQKQAQQKQAQQKQAQQKQAQQKQVQQKQVQRRQAQQKQPQQQQEQQQHEQQETVQEEQPELQLSVDYRRPPVHDTPGPSSRAEDDEIENLMSLLGINSAASSSIGPADGEEIQQPSMPNYIDDMSENMHDPKGKRVISDAPTQEELECPICFEKCELYVIAPCGHLGVCETCTHEVRKTDQCPFCKNQVQDFIRIYNVARTKTAD